MQSSVIAGAPTVREAFDHVLRIAERHLPLGQETYANGARRIGHIPWVAPLAYLHTVFPPVPDEEVSALPTIIGRQPPPAYRELLRHSNGLYLFGGSLYLYGIRRSFSRAPEVASSLPWDIGTPHTRREPPAIDCDCPRREA